MFELADLKETRFYKDVKEEGELEAKFKSVPRLLKKGLSLEDIAEALELDLKLAGMAARGELPPD